MTLTLALAAVLLVAAGAALLARSKAARLRRGGRLNSLPNYHAGYAFLWAAVPALLLLAVWSPVQQRLVQQAVLESPAGQKLPEFEMVRETILSEAYEIATGQREAGFNPESTTLAPVYKQYLSRYAAIGGGIAIVLAIAGAAWGLSRVRIEFRARSGVERWVRGTLIAASLIAIFTTLGIVLSLMFESRVVL
jgi:phosphate transport system permease protein